MKQRFTKLLAAFALLVFMLPSLAVWGQTNVTILSEDFTNGKPDTWSYTGNTSIQSGTLQLASSNGAGSATTPVFSSLVGSSATLTFDIASSGSSVNTLTITGNNCKVNGNSSTTALTSAESVTIAITEASTTSTITFSAVKKGGCRIDNVEVYYTTGGSTTTYNVNVSSSITGGTVSASPLSAEAGQSVTLTATPNSAYTFNNIASNWSVTDGDNQTIQVTPASNNTATFEMPESDVTVSATFTAKPTHSITIASDIENGSVTASPTSAYEGQTVNLTVTPAPGYALNTLTATYVNGSGETQTFNISNNSFQMPNSDVTINATFISNTFEGTFEKYTETIVEGDYLLVYNNKAMNNDNATTASKLQYTTVAPNNNNITNPDRSIVWHIAPSETSGYWTIYNAACNKFVSGAANSTNLTLVNSESDNSTWKVSGTYDFRCKANESNNARYIRYYSDNDVYGNYASSNGGALTLYKLKQSVAPAWSTEFPTTASILTNATYELTVSDYVSGEPAPSITLATEVPSSLYEFEDGEFMFGSSTAGTYVFTFTATNSAGMDEVVLTITVNAPVQVNYYYSANGVLDSGTTITQGESVTLANGSDFNSDYIFAGWTLNPNDIENILLAGSTQTIIEETIFYAVYSRTESVAEEKVVILDGDASGLTTTAQEVTLSENGFSYYSSSAKYQPLGTDPENNISTGKTILIGKKDAYLKNTTAFGQGITKFEIYANKGAAVAATAGIYFSASEISEYTTSENTWQSPSDGMGSDKLYDASSVIPTGAKYFWYQVTNDRNTQVQFRITYISINSTTEYYTYVGTKEIAGYGDNHAVKNGWYLIASPVANDFSPSADNGFLTDYYDLYRFDQSADLEWQNHEVHGFDIESGHGYLYASSTNTTLVFAGTPYNGDGVVELNHSQNADYDGFNLVGNPLATSATINLPFYKMNDGHTALTSKLESGTIAAMEGAFVYAYDETTQQAISSVAFTASRSRGNSNASVNIDVMHNGANIDNAIVRFDEGRQLPKYQLFKNSTKLYITKNGKDYAIVNSEAQGEMPVNFKAQENGTYTLNINTENVEMNYLHLIDNMTGMDVDLLQTPNYTFDATTNDYTSRFRLVFSANDVNEQNAETFAFFSNGNWVIGNEGEATLQVIDVNGRIVSNETINGSVATSINATPGVYMLRLVNGNEVKTQKIVVR